MKVYCDRLAEVVMKTRGNPVTGAGEPFFLCPKCNGRCVRKQHPGRIMWDCLTCHRGWEEVPDSITTPQGAEEWLFAREYKEGGEEEEDDL